MNEEKDIPGLSYFDRMMGTIHELPDVVSTKSTTMRVVPPWGIGSHTYIVQTFRQREIGDTVFFEMVAENETIRVVIPPKVSEVIARQRDQLTAKSRSRAGKARAALMKEQGIQPGFMKKKS